MHRNTFIPKQRLRAQVKHLEDLLKQSEANNDLHNKVNGALREAFERLFPAAFNNPNLIRSDSWGARANPSKDHEAHTEYFKFIPMSPIDIIMAITDVISLFNENLMKRGYCPCNPYSEVKFLDVGCGLGNVVFLASSKFDAYGIEFSEEYVQAARKMLASTFSHRNMDNHIIHCDALDYNDYNQYDVIYWYRPIRDAKLMTNLATRVAKQMKVGAYLIPIGHHSIWHDVAGNRAVPLDEHHSFQSTPKSRVLKKIAPME